MPGEVDEKFSLELECVKRNQQSYIDAITAMESEWLLSCVGNQVRVVCKSNYTIQLDPKQAVTIIEEQWVTRHLVKFVNHQNTIVPIGKAYSCFNEWMKETTKYFGIEFRPDMPFGTFQDKNKNYWNTWNGWAYKPISDPRKNPTLYFTLIKEVICSGNQEAYDFVLDWMAQIIQQPEKKTPKVIALTGVQGAGKTQFVNHFMKLFGDYALTIDSAMLESNFNAPFQNKLMLFSDEAFWSGDVKLRNKLKSFITSDKMNIEYKGRDSFSTRNYVRMILATNDEFSNPNEERERRYVSLQVSTKAVGKSTFFKELNEQMTNGGYEYLLYFLLERPISTRDWNKTYYFDESFIHNRLQTVKYDNPVALWIVASLTGSCSPVFLDRSGERVGRTYLWEKYVEWEKNEKNPKQLSGTDFDRKLSKFFPPTRDRDSRYRVFDANNIFEMKQKLNEFLGFDFETGAITENDDGLSYEDVDDAITLNKIKELEFELEGEKTGPIEKFNIHDI